MNDTWQLATPDDTRAFGEALGAAAQGGEILLLRGHLGAGKTCLTQGLARGLGVPSAQIVTSPTFTLHQQYQGRLRLDHVDLYRLAPGEDEEGDPLPAALDTLHGVGLDDWLGAADGVCAIEWPEVFGPAAPADALTVTLDADADGIRRVVAAAAGPRAAAWLERVAH